MMYSRRRRRIIHGANRLVSSSASQIISNLREEIEQLKKKNIELNEENFKLGDDKRKMGKILMGLRRDLPEFFLHNYMPSDIVYMIMDYCKYR